jgi:hypothetical protein
MTAHNLRFDTIMEGPMRDAGYKPSDEAAWESIRKLARDAWGKYQDPLDAGHRRGRIAFMTETLSAEWLYALFMHWPGQSFMQQGLLWLLKEALQDIEDAKPNAPKKPGAAAGPNPDRDPRCARPAANPSPDEDQATSNLANPNPPPNPDPLADTSNNLEYPPPYSDPGVAAKVAGFYMFNPFDDIIVAGRALGKCTFDEATNWFRQQIAMTQRGIARRQAYLRRCEANLLFVQRLKANRLGDDFIGAWYPDLQEVRTIYGECLEAAETAA